MSHIAQQPSSCSVTAEPGPAVVVGIDPGLDKHGVAALKTGSCYRLGRREIPNTVVGMQLLAQLLAEWQGPTAGRLLIGIEEATAYARRWSAF